MEVQNEAKWYVLHTITGYENVALENLKLTVEKYNLQNRVFDIIIPIEEVVEEKKGKKVVVQRKLMPTYIFVKMIYGDDIWHAITRTRGITGFVGPKGRPLPLTEDEVIKTKLEKIQVDESLKEGDQVEILDGALVGQIGTLQMVDFANIKCRVIVSLFGRDTPVDLALDQVRRI